MLIPIGDKEIEGVMSVRTLMVYEQQFGGADMIAELFGRPKAGEDNDEVIFDFTATNWTKVLKVAWAMARAADAATPGFDAWSADVGEVNVQKIADVVMPAVYDAFFHPAAPAEG